MKLPFLELKHDYHELRGEFDATYHRVMNAGSYRDGRSRSGIFVLCAKTLAHYQFRRTSRELMQMRVGSWATIVTEISNTELSLPLGPSLAAKEWETAIRAVCQLC
jgi:hypothetical protein